MLGETWLGLEDKNIFRLKYEGVCPQCFGYFFAQKLKSRPKHRAQTHWCFNPKIYLSTRPSNVFPSMGPWTGPGAQNEKGLVCFCLFQLPDWPVCWKKVRIFRDLVQIETDEAETWHTLRLLLYQSACQVSASYLSIYSSKFKMNLAAQITAVCRHSRALAYHYRKNYYSKK